MIFLSWLYFFFTVSGLYYAIIINIYIYIYMHRVTKREKKKIDIFKTLIKYAIALTDWRKLFRTWKKKNEAWRAEIISSSSLRYVQATEKNRVLILKSICKGEEEKKEYRGPWIHSDRALAPPLVVALRSCTYTGSHSYQRQVSIYAMGLDLSMSYRLSNLPFPCVDIINMSYFLSRNSDWREKKRKQQKSNLV